MKNILIATDSSKHSKKASEVGIEMAKLFGAKVTTLYVIDVGKECASIGVLESNEGDDLISRIRSSLQSQGEEATGRIEEMAKSAGLTVDRVIIEGRPAEDILKLAGERKTDLIVVGGIGVTGLEKFLLGSVAEKVVRNSKVPVLVVRAN
ncbi:MAG: universal stress protein [Methanothrix soehngenii]|jgi:nucleotide-binding universal stress UspA family protein|uniref:universal stress protein n=1 Tax=Methanothrix TaxID=2222 RepID=UPI0023F12C91|nr:MULTISPECIES: universal stress protein [Methanothrix]MCK9405937.1 universal stress protein [Methanothrix sp.]MCK9586668.1 universal stress protein [Methanothrix soehngenii]MDD3974754.1 universal stress protein [Methanothrix soehngenii]MDD4487910.1 universal stress protein [Methanothrix soehngenii]MDD5257653.1 universal stress protein [Methanothrix soehngenii]